MIPTGAKIETMKRVESLNLTSGHSHIRGIGVDDSLEPRNVAQGMVG